MKNVKENFLNTAFIMIGSFILAVGINVFLIPNKISSGGVSSIGTILLYLFGIRVSITNIIINIILFAIGYKFLGRASVIKTIIGILALTVFLEITSYFPVYSDNTMLSTIVGGVLIGVGVGLVVRKNASTGGSDFLALVIKHLAPHLSLANIIFMLDSVVIIISGIAFKSLTITIYSIIAMYISSKTADVVITFGNGAKSAQIFSSRAREIADYIMERFQRGVTGIHCIGMFSHEEKLMLLCALSPKELPLLVEAVKQIDSSAFIIINDARSVLGEGFNATIIN